MIDREKGNDNACNPVGVAVNSENPTVIRTAKTSEPRQHRFVATGVVANARLTPLLRGDWEDITSRSTRTALEKKNSNANNQESSSIRKIPDFLWENSPRHETKEIRDHVKVYSHLPNGINILDSKWVLGRLFSKANDDENDHDHDPLLATCETHCFTGLDGFHSFARSVKLLAGPESDPTQQQVPNRKLELSKLISNLPDISNTSNKHIPDQISLERPPMEVMNWWVVKDAGANGAGGVWVVGPENVDSFGSSPTSPIIDSHKYVAQQYVWPPVLYDSKKSHVRVYVIVTCDGQAFVHRRSFLHVANDPFTIDSTSGDSSNDNDAAFDDQIHITNCCANSHDDTKFAGEILADFGQTEYTLWKDEKGNQQPVVPLADFFPSIKATVAQVVQRSFQRGLLDGGEKNNGFEYCGMDFMLSYKKRTNGDTLPVAYLLEINSPPSQDTASSLSHAEDLHNEVLRDWMTCWVIPRVDPTVPSRPGGWINCEVKHKNFNKAKKEGKDSELAIPSKAAMLNKIRWALFERKLQKKESVLTQNVSEASDSKRKNGNEKGTQQQTHDNYPSAIEISRFARSQFPFFSTHSCTTYDNNCGDSLTPQIFFENAGGAQVPKAVIDQMTLSLMRRHRNKIGSESKTAARETLRRLLVGGTEETSQSSVVILGLNATSLLVSLAHCYARLLTPADEVLISTENHLANFDPWIQAAKTAGAKIKLWAPFYDQKHHSSYDESLQDFEYEISSDLHHLVTPQTRIVTLPHASNVLGSVRPILDISKTIKDKSKGYAHIVVDGVAVAPHEFVGFDENFGEYVDWYVVSMHKLFGPHIGVLLGRQHQCMDDLLEKASPLPASRPRKERAQDLLESGTANIEGCAGVVGLGMYLKSLCNWYKHKTIDFDNTEMISVHEAKLAYSMIRKVEVTLVEMLLRALARSSQVRVLDGSKLNGFPETGTKQLLRLPTVSFVHSCISSHEIYMYCQERGIICRNGFFLCTNYLATDFHFNHHQDGALRISLAHYNTSAEVQTLCDTLESMPNWFGNPLLGQ